MTISDIVALRLHNQHLSNPNFTSVHDVVTHLGAVQSQDYPAAKWALSLRMDKTIDEHIEQAINTGTILRTHIMRPTWHFVTPENIRWMLDLTTPQVKKLLAHYDRKLGITDEIRIHSQKIFTKALKNNNFLTRTELAEELGKNNIPARGQLLGHIVAHAELDAVICSGPRRGKHFTYALLEERAPGHKIAPGFAFNREESLAKLTLTYFTSHGPAQIKDFSWWSGLSMKDATHGIDLIKSQLVSETIDEKTYWWAKNAKIPSSKNKSAYLLSIYDEYVIAYKDRSAICETQFFKKLFAMGNALSGVVILDGQIVGSWKRVIKKDTIEMKLDLFRTVTSAEKDLLHEAVQKYGKFMQMKVTSNL